MKTFKQHLSENYSGNKFYKVMKPIPFREPGPLKPSGEYYGSAQLHRKSYPAEHNDTLKKGDEVHHLVGGKFFVRKGGKKVHEGGLMSDEAYHHSLRGAFEKTYLHRDHEAEHAKKLVASGHLEEISHHLATKPTGGYRK